MATEIIRADQVPLDEQARLFTEAFRGYVGGSFDMDAAGLARFLCAQGADLCHSRLARNAKGLCGFAYLGRTGSASRICGMGVPTAARRGGIARQLLQHLIAEAGARGDETLLLEVIQQNPAAHTLYEQTGFRTVDYLSGWRKPASGATEEPPVSPQALDDTSLTRASQSPSAFEFPDIPWPVSRHAVAKILSACAYSHGDATIVISNPITPGPVRVHALSVSESAGKWLAMREALRAVLQIHPGREFFTPPVFPENFGREIFLPLNFVKEPLAQFHMRYDKPRNSRASHSDAATGESQNEGDFKSPLL